MKVYKRLYTGQGAPYVLGQTNRLFSGWRKGVEVKYLSQIFRLIYRLQTLLVLFSSVKYDDYWSIFCKK